MNNLIPGPSGLKELREKIVLVDALIHADDCKSKDVHSTRCKASGEVLGLFDALFPAQPGAAALIQALYDAEINFRISSFWDAGYTVEIGDEINGFKAADQCLYGLDAVAAALWRMARNRYPDLPAEPGPPASSPSQDSQEVREAVDDLRSLRDHAASLAADPHYTQDDGPFILNEHIVKTLDKALALLSQSPKGAAGAGRECWVLFNKTRGNPVNVFGHYDMALEGPGIDVVRMVEAAGGDGPSAPKTGLRGAARLCIGCGHDERVPVRDEAHPNALACCPDHDYRTPDAAARYARDLVPDARALVEGWILDFLRTEPAPGDVGSAGGDKA